MIKYENIILRRRIVAFTGTWTSDLLIYVQLLNYYTIQLKYQTQARISLFFLLLYLLSWQLSLPSMCVQENYMHLRYSRFISDPDKNVSLEILIEISMQVMNLITTFHIINFIWKLIGKSDLNWLIKIIWYFMENL